MHAFTRDEIRRLLDAAREPVRRVEARRYLESEGTFLSDPVPSDLPCPACGSVLRRTFRPWASDDGAFVDGKYECGACGDVRWIDGPDS